LGAGHGELFAADQVVGDAVVAAQDGRGGQAGDLNHDWIVDYRDVLVLLEDWGCTGGEPGDSPGDADLDGDTDQGDLAILLANWGNVCP